MSQISCMGSLLSARPPAVDGGVHKGGEVRAGAPRIVRLPHPQLRCLRAKRACTFSRCWLARRSCFSLRRLHA